jgi:hypothetical protein
MMAARLKSVRKVVLVGLLLTALCLSTGSCFRGDRPPTGWRKIEARKFSLYAPPGWKLHDREGIDSYVGEFAGSGMALKFDFGQYSNSLSEAQEPSYVVDHKLIHGSWARIVSPRMPGRGITGVYFPSVLYASKLCLVGHDLTAAQQEVALRIFRTIRIEEVGL